MKKDLIDFWMSIYFGLLEKKAIHLEIHRGWCCDIDSFGRNPSLKDWHVTLFVVEKIWNLYFPNSSHLRYPLPQVPQETQATTRSSQGGQNFTSCRGETWVGAKGRGVVEICWKGFAGIMAHDQLKKAPKKIGQKSLQVTIHVCVVWFPQFGHNFNKAFVLENETGRCWANLILFPPN